MNTFDKLSDTYEVIGEIGSGGGGTVFKARHRRLDKEVVIKKVHTDIKDVVDCGAEANILKNLRHSYLPQVLDLFIIDGNVYTVMDFIPGQSFQQLLDEKKRFPQKKVIKWAIQLSEALVYLHKQNPPIIHSDIKPANIMLTPSDDICLIDFNISSIFTGKGARTIGFSDGYSPPEQYKIYYEILNDSKENKTADIFLDNYPAATEVLIQSQVMDATEILPNNISNDKAYQQIEVDLEENRKQSETILGYALVNEKSDIYSFGATLYHILTGVKPQKATGPVVPVANYDVKISDGMIYIITKAMEKEPSKRFSSSAQLLKSLLNIGKLDRRYKRFMAVQEITFIGIMLLISGSFLLIHFGKLKMSEEKKELYSYYIAQLTTERQLENYEKIESIYEDAVNLYPDKIEAYYQRSLLLYEKQDYETAIEYIKDIIMPDYNLEQSDMMKDIYFILANCYFELDEYVDAIVYFRAAIALNKSNSEYYRDYAISLARIGDTDKASEALNEAISIGIADDSVYLINGEIDLSNQNYLSGEQNFLRCIQVSDDPYIKMRAYIMCDELYDTVIQVNSEAIAEEVLLKKLKLLKEAKNTLPIDLTLGINERLIQANIDAGTYFNDNNYYLYAIEESQNLMKLNWDTYDTYNNIIILYQKIGDIDNAFDTANQMLTKYGEDYKIYKRLCFLELDVQSLKDNQSRDYFVFRNYYENAKKLYDEKMKNNKNDVEMIHLDEIEKELLEGGWFN